MTIDQATIIKWAAEYRASPTEQHGFVADTNPKAVNALGKSVPIGLLEHIARRAVEQERAELQPQDPMDWPLPCNITVGHVTIRKGVPLRTLVLRNKVLYKMATGNDADDVANQSVEERAKKLKEFMGRLTLKPFDPA